MKRGTFAIIITCILHIATEMCPTNILVTGRDYGEIPALVTRGVFTSTRGNGVLADRYPGSSGLSPPMANGRLSTPRCTTLATQSSGYGRIQALILLRGVLRATRFSHVVNIWTVSKVGNRLYTVLSSSPLPASSTSPPRCALPTY